MIKANKLTTSLKGEMVTVTYRTSFAVITAKFQSNTKIENVTSAINEVLKTLTTA
jgi:hypothetical protein